MEDKNEPFRDQTFPITVEELPDEVLEFILGFLAPYNDLQSCMLVSKRWNICASSK